MKGKKKINFQTELTGWILNGPYLIYAIILFVIPIVWAFWLTMLDWNLISADKEFVGLGNFKELFGDPHIQAAFTNSFKYLFAIVVLTLIAGLIVGLICHNLPNSIKGYVSVMFFIPYLTSGVATAVVVKYLLSYNSVLNTMLRDSFGIDIAWLQDPFWSFWVMVFLVVWKMGGYYGLFIFSGLESISEDIHEACELDGSKGLHKLFHILIPNLLPTITTVVVLASGLAYSLFTEPYLLTGGGPAMATTTWQLEIYNASFVNFDSGYGAAIAMACAFQIFVTLKLVSYLMNKLNNKYGA